MTDFVGAIDEGTSSTRFVLFDRDCNIAHIEQEQLKNYYPHTGWVEMDPMEILTATQRVMDRCVAKATKQAGRAVKVHGVGVTVQRETTVVWDKRTGKPLYNAIVWSDTRTADICQELEQKLGGKDHFRPVCGLPISPYFSAMKLLWLLRQKDIAAAVKEGHVLFGTLDTWLIWHLSGGPNGGQHVTDVTNASRTMLMNLHTRQWDVPTLSKLHISPAVLPKIRSCSEVYGHIRASVLQGVPLCAAIGDQQSALLGQLCVEPGTAKNTYGTGCFMLMNMGDKPVQSKTGLLSTVAFQLGPDAPCLYALEGSVAVAGAAIRWLQEKLELIKSPQEIDQYAANVPEGNHGVYFVPAFSGLFSPYWRPDARGVLVGLTAYTDKAHLCRAVLESVAYSTFEQLEGMTKDSGIELKSLKVDGGMVRSSLLMQFQANLLDVKVEVPASLEATAKGAAIAAGLAVKFWSGIPELQRLEAKNKGDHCATYVPKMNAQFRAHIMEGWKVAINRTLEQEKYCCSQEHYLARAMPAKTNAVSPRFSSWLKLHVLTVLHLHGNVSSRNDSIALFRAWDSQTKYTMMHKRY
eukprot:g41754.t1